MQLSRLYTNLDEVFAPIHFNAGAASKRLNVVFAEVTRKKTKDGDSHNLGKTTLIEVLDFLLLKDITSTDHFLERHRERFGDFVFYLEVALHGGGYATVRRPVLEPTKISLLRSKATVADARSIDAADWDHWDITLTAAREALDAYLDLTVIPAPFDYRTGVSYFLRTQDDYRDYFQIQKFMSGKDRAWKPYLSAVLGLDHEAITTKYELEDEMAEKTLLRANRLSEIDLKNRDRGELATRIEIARDEIDEIDEQLDQFNFHEVEVQLNKRVVEEVEQKLSALAGELYDLDVDIAQLEQSLAAGIKFDLARIKEIFEESRVLFSDSLSRSYEELVDFNRKLTRERNRALKDRSKELQQKRDVLLAEHQRQSNERQRLLAIVQQADTFRKYKALQKDQSERRALLTFLENELARLDVVGDLDRQLRDLRNKKDTATTAIERSLNRDVPIKNSVTRLFNRYVKEVLGINGEFIVGQNTSGNVDFEIRTKDRGGDDTSQDKGHSYHRLLAALFDLAVLKALEELPFYHFVYHDGILEGLDNRVKVRLLKLVRDTISGGHIQYILSVIDTDLPRDIETQQQIPFANSEVVLVLNDRGDEGRLFRTKPF